jgi:hypothetical protein
MPADPVDTADPADMPSSFDRLLRHADANPAVVGLVLIGSRSVEAMATPHSDHDVIAVVESDHARAAEWHDLRSPDLDVVGLPLAELPGYALHGHPESYNRYAFVHAKVLRDRLGGRIAELVAAKACLSAEEARDLATAALDAYVNSAYRSLKHVRDARPTAAHLDAAESVPHLLTTLFAIHGRIRPYNKYLEWELRHRPLPDEWFGGDGLLPGIGRILRDGDADTQRGLFADVERLSRAAGLGDVLDAWGPSLTLLRPRSAQPLRERPSRATSRP